MDIRARLPAGFERAPHIFVPMSNDGALATELIITALVDSGTDPDLILVVWPLAHFRAPCVPPRVRVATGPSDMIVTRGTVREVIKRFEIAFWWRSVRRVHGDLLDRPGHWYIKGAEMLPDNEAFHDPRRLSLSLLPDGMESYLNVSLKPRTNWQTAKFRVRRWLEAVSARAAGRRFRGATDGHPSQYHTGAYDRTYTFDPAGLVAKCGELLVLARPQCSTQRQLDPRLAVVADQELDRLFDDSVAIRMREVMAAELNRLDLSCVLYKKHPRGRDRLEELAARLKHRVVRVDDTGPLEKFMEREGIGALFSFFSTCLVTVSGDAGLRRTAILPPKGSKADTEVVCEIRKMLDRAGVHIVAAGCTEDREKADVVMKWP